MDDKKRLGEILIEAGVVDKFQLKSALAEQNKWGGRLGNHLVQMGILTEELLVKALSKQLKIPYLDLSQMAIPKEVLTLVPQELAEKFHLVPVAVKKIANKKTLVVAMSDPTNLDAIDELQFRTGHIIKPAVDGDTAIEMAIRRFYYGETAPVHKPGEPIALEANDPNAPASTHNDPTADVHKPPEQTFAFDSEPTAQPGAAPPPVAEASLADLGAQPIPPPSFNPPAAPGFSNLPGIMPMAPRPPSAPGFAAPVAPAFQPQPEPAAFVAAPDPFVGITPMPAPAAASWNEAAPAWAAEPAPQPEYLEPLEELPPEPPPAEYADATPIYENLAPGAMEPAPAAEPSIEPTVIDPEPPFANGTQAAAWEEPSTVPPAEAEAWNGTPVAEAEPPPVLQEPVPEAPPAWAPHESGVESPAWAEPNADPTQPEFEAAPAPVESVPVESVPAQSFAPVEPIAEAVRAEADATPVDAPEAAPAYAAPEAAFAAPEDAPPYAAPEAANAAPEAANAAPEDAPEFVAPVSAVEPPAFEPSAYDSPLPPGTVEAAVAAAEAVSAWSAADAVRTDFGTLPPEPFEPTSPGEPTYAGEESSQTGLAGSMPPAELLTPVPQTFAPANSAAAAEEAAPPSEHEELMAAAVAVSASAEMGANELDPPAWEAPVEPPPPEDPFALIPYETAEGLAIRALAGLMIEKGLLTAEELAARLKLFHGGSDENGNGQTQ